MSPDVVEPRKVRRMILRPRARRRRLVSPEKARNVWERRCSDQLTWRAVRYLNSGSVWKEGVVDCNVDTQ
jgi:hypothetical protein